MSNVISVFLMFNLVVMCFPSFPSFYFTHRISLSPQQSAYKKVMASLLSDFLRWATFYDQTASKHSDFLATLVSFELDLDPTQSTDDALVQTGEESWNLVPPPKGIWNVVRVASSGMCPNVAVWDIAAQCKLHVLRRALKEAFMIHQTENSLVLLVFGAQLNYHLWNSLFASLYKRWPLNAESSTWSEWLAAWAIELNISTLALSMRPKAPEIWEQRRRLFDLLARSLDASPLCNTLWVEALRLEFSVINERAIRSHPRNYPAWAHRSSATFFRSPAHVPWRLLSCSTPDSLLVAAQELFKCEVDTCIFRLSRDFGDASAVSHAVAALQQLLMIFQRNKTERSILLVDTVLATCWLSLHRFMRLSRPSIFECGTEAHPALWMLRRGLCVIGLSLSCFEGTHCSADTRLCRGWTLGDELVFCSHLCELEFFSLSDPKLQKPEDEDHVSMLCVTGSGWLPHQVAAARHGCWLCQEVSKSFSK